MAGGKDAGKRRKVAGRCFGVRRLDATFHAPVEQRETQSAVESTPREMLARGPRSRGTPILFWICDREVAFFATHEQPWQASWRSDFDFYLVPLAVEARRLIADGILVTQL